MAILSGGIGFERSCVRDSGVMGVAFLLSLLGARGSSAASTRIFFLYPKLFYNTDKYWVCIVN